MILSNFPSRISANLKSIEGTLVVARRDSPSSYYVVTHSLNFRPIVVCLKYASGLNYFAHATIEPTEGSLIRCDGSYYIPITVDISDCFFNDGFTLRSPFNSTGAVLSFYALGR
jgi:hypothetical protein